MHVNYLKVVGMNRRVSFAWFSNKWNLRKNKRDNKIAMELIKSREQMIQVFFVSKIVVTY